MAREALIILVGVTAGERGRRRVMQFFSHNSDYAVFVPALPYRTGLRAAATWLSRYLADTVVPARFSAVHGIAYIAGGLLLRCLDRGELPAFARLVQFRSPVQEQVAAAVVGLIGRRSAGCLHGRAVLDLADGWPQTLPPLSCARQQGLILELGRSRMARLFGIERGDPDAWQPERLLPGATAVLRIPESHDDVYNSGPVLDAALSFLRRGQFPAQKTP